MIPFTIERLQDVLFFKVNGVTRFYLDAAPRQRQRLDVQGRHSRCWVPWLLRGVRTVSATCGARSMNYLKLNDRARRNDNGRGVRIVDVQPNGLRVFYLTEDMQDGHTAIIEHADLRPFIQKQVD
jgi:hypothetical protein